VSCSDPQDTSSDLSCSRPFLADRSHSPTAMPSVDPIGQNDRELETCVPSWMHHALESDVMFPGLVPQFCPLPASSARAPEDISLGPSHPEKISLPRQECIGPAMSSDEVLPRASYSKRSRNIWQFTLGDAAGDAAFMRMEQAPLLTNFSPSPSLLSPTPENLPGCVFQAEVDSEVEAPHEIPSFKQIDQNVPQPDAWAGHRSNACESAVANHDLKDKCFWHCGDPHGLLSGQCLSQQPEEIAGPQDLPLKIPIYPLTNMDSAECHNQQHQYLSSYPGGCDVPAAAAALQAGTVSDDERECRWHKSAENVGWISQDGHVFAKTAGPRRSRVSDQGARVELASICMVFDATLRIGGVHRYTYQIMDGKLGAADGAGFVFDKKVRRNNIQRMRSVFLNQRGRICLRNNGQVRKLQAQLPPLTVGVSLSIIVDLNLLVAFFSISNSQGIVGGTADVNLDSLSDFGLGNGSLRSGFFCAVVTGDITIGLH